MGVRAATLGFIACAGAVAGFARADNTKVACVSAHEQALKLRGQRKLVAARAELVKCAREACPGPVKKECARLIGEVDAQIPTVVFDARDIDGRPTADVRVRIDGTSLVDSLSGAAVSIDPGEHTFRFDAATGETLEQKLLMLEGDKNRKIAIDFSTLKPQPQPQPPTTSTTTSSGAPPPPPSSPEKKGIPTESWLLGGVAIVGLGLFTGFAIAGKSKEKSLASDCAPRCSSSDVSPVKRDYAIGDVSLAVAVIAAAAAIVIAWPSSSATPPSTGVGVGPTTGGATLGAWGVF